MIVLPLAPGKMRLKALHERVPGISTGVLDRHVQVMVALGLVTRTRFRETPPRVELELTQAGRELLPIVGALTRWGMRHMWSMPKAGEHVRVDALLRLLPVLLGEVVALPDASVEATVTDAEQPHDRVRYRIEQGRVELDAPGAAGAAASIHGSWNAWIAALGPERDYTALSFAGEDAGVGQRLLEALPRPA
jgi:DNA-binding HxlR family transcriptional regulator